jgi:transposase
MSKDKNYVGIDVSKSDFDVSFSSGEHRKYSNDIKGFQKLMKALPLKAHCVMEQTGRYHQLLAHFLYENEICVSVVNALTIKRFVQMRLKITKTDKADARMIREYGAWDFPALWSPPAAYIVRCKELRQLVSLLLKQSTALKNQRHSIELSGAKGGLALRIIKKKLKAIKADVKMLEAEMETLIKTNEGDLVSHISSIPGVGQKTAMALVVSTNAFRDFENSNQLSSYFGLAPTMRLSGSSIRGRSRISKAGDKDVRNLLFMCSFTACKHNKPCVALYQRIVNKGKSPKLALIAVANKLLKQALAIAKSGIQYDQNYKSKNPIMR